MKAQFTLITTPLHPPQRWAKSECKLLTREQTVTIAGAIIIDSTTDIINLIFLAVITDWKLFISNKGIRTEQKLFYPCFGERKTSL